MRKLYRSTLFFTCLLALVMVISRLIIVDGPSFFSLAHIPNHDMYQGASYFMTNLHSMRLNGDIAWWNPAYGIGYAQYPQFMISPLAPTANNIVFMIWMQVISVLARVGIAMSEYMQYLVITYIVFPFLAFWAFSSFISLLFKHRLTILIITIVFAFSGIGFWYGTWLYFQEPFLLFFFLYGLVRFCQRPTRRSLLILLVALLLQATSINYWTLYNSWFIIMFMVSYGAAHWNQVRRMLVRLWRMMKENKGWAVVLGVSTVIVLGLWALIVVSTLSELGAYARTDKPFGVDIAYGRIFNFPSILGDAFSPFLVPEQAGQNPAHAARYIGLLVIPFGAIFFCYRWRRTERFWFLLAIMVFGVIMAPPLLLRAWEYIPSMSLIRHLFYFYQHYWQLALVFMAGFGLDYIQRPPQERAGRVAPHHIFMGSILVGLGVVILVNLLPLPQAGETFRSYQVSLFGWLLLLYSLIGYLFVTQPRARGILACALVVLTYQDMTRYLYEVSRADTAFTTNSRYQALSPQPYEITPQDKLTLLKTWDQPNPLLAFSGGLVTSNVQLPNSMWPKNNYMVPNTLRALGTNEAFGVLQSQALEGFALQFFEAKDVQQRHFNDVMAVSDPAALEQMAQLLPWTLFIEDDPASLITANTAAITASSAADTFDFHWLEWTYNEHTIQVEMPRDGWVLIRQLYSPNWQLWIDDAPAALTQAYGADMATFVPQGSHTLSLKFLPLARRYYWLAVVALEALLVLLIGLIVMSRKRRVA